MGAYISGFYEKLRAIMFLMMIVTFDGCTKFHMKKSQTARYFDGVEVQYENKAQKDTIIQALNDILNLSEEDLKTKRYPDYAGRRDIWNLSVMISRYFVPDDPNKSLGDNLYRELKSNEVQQKIKKIMGTLTFE